jgi:hypothetical protein
MKENSYTVSEYIEIKPNTDYYMDTAISMNSPAYCFYDETKNYISGASYNRQTTFAFVSPINAKYIRLSVPKSDQTDFALREGNDGHIWT